MGYGFSGFSGPTMLGLLARNDSVCTGAGRMGASEVLVGAGSGIGVVDVGAGLNSDCPMVARVTRLDSLYVVCTTL